MNDLEDLLPPKPDAPHPSDCCGTGCSPCVHDIYEKDLKTWKKSCELIRSQRKEDYPQHDKNIICCTEYSSFELVKIDQMTHDTFMYTFLLPENRCLGLQVGQHLIVKGFYNNRFISRPYTPVSDLCAEGMFQLLIKIYPKGKMSSIVSGWKVNDEVEMRGPYGSFTYLPNSFKKILMLAAGTGIAPMFQLIKYILANEDDLTRIHVMYSSRTFKDILLREELQALQAHWNLTICHYLSKEETLKEKKYMERAELRRLSKRDVEEEIQKEHSDNSLILISGTKSFDKDMINAVKNIGEIPENHIFKF